MKEYKELLKCVKHQLNKEGLKKHKNSLLLFESGNVGVIGFQKSTKSNQTQTIFTINLGIYNSALAKYYDDIVLDNTDIEDCHWRRRIGFYLPVKKDYWWSIYNDSDVDKMCSEMVEMINNLAIPVLKNYISDSSLEDAWKKGESFGLTDFERLLNLTVLIKLNNSEGLELYIDELRRKTTKTPFEGIAERHIAQLGK